ncbi:alpha/beta fold hydrolase [soil metagenome]
MRSIVLRIVLASLVLLAVWIVYANVVRSIIERASRDMLAPSDGQWIETADGRMFVQRFGTGTGPVVLLVHGTGAWSGTWFGTPQALVDRGFRVVALDLPPFGFSAARAPADYSRGAQARRIAAVVDALGAGPVSLVGHSFGAGPALEAAMTLPDRYRQLVMVDPALGLGSGGEPPACESGGMASVLLAQRPVRTALLSTVVTPIWAGQFWLSRFVSRKEVVNDESILPYQRPFGRRDFTADLGDWAEAFANGNCEPAASLSVDSIRQWAATGPRVELIWGETDAITPIAQAGALRAWIPQARLKTVPAVGHIPHLEDPATFNAALIETLQAAAAN